MDSVHLGCWYYDDNDFFVEVEGLTMWLAGSQVPDQRLSRAMAVKALES